MRSRARVQRGRACDTPVRNSWQQQRRSAPLIWVPDARGPDADAVHLVRCLTPRSVAVAAAPAVVTARPAVVVLAVATPAVFILAVAAAAVAVLAVRGAAAFVLAAA